MKQEQHCKLWMLAAVMLWGLSWLASCTDNSDNPCGGSMDYSTSLFVATDRHEAGRGNNLTVMLARAVAGSGIRPQTVLLGGDYVGGRGDMTPEFTIKDLYDEVYAIVDPLNTRVMMTYGSHDDNCTEGYNGIDQTDRYGISAESATRSFTQWVSTIADSDPIVVMSHVPLHANRGDNVGAMTWYEALTPTTMPMVITIGWNCGVTVWMPMTSIASLV